MIRADEARRAIEARHADARKRVEAAIDHAITNSPRADYVAVSLSETVPEVVTELLGVYAEGGWDVTVQRHSDQRDGDSTAFVLRPRVDRPKVRPMRGEGDVGYPGGR